MNLSTTYLGLSLRSPLVASASPLSEKIDNLKRLEEAGASAVVLYSLFEEQVRREHDAMLHFVSYGTESFSEALSYFPEPIKYRSEPYEYIEHIHHAKRALGIPVIASLNGSSVGGWTKYASMMEEAGADALELNIYYIPSDPFMSGEQVEQTYVDILTAVKSAVKTIPVAVKLSPYFSNMANMAHKLELAGANALVLFNRFYQPDIDMETLEVRPNVLLSTAQSLRVPLRWIGILYGRIKVDLAATGGIHSGVDAAKMLMVGSTVTMMTSALLKNGIGHVRTVEQELLAWMHEHEYESVDQMRGAMSQLSSGDPSTFERVQYMRALTSYSILP
jgi:dihydroorotate dehydrogenase (fumarate)